MGRYAALDGLRGIAAVAVVLLHVGEYELGVTPLNAHLAVDFFFLLSGFVLAHAYPKPGAAYLIARLVRLYPLYVAGVALGAALLISTGLKDPPGVIAGALALNVVMAPALQLGDNVFPFDHPLWSITYELVLSVGWLALARFFGGWRLWTLLAAAGALWLAFPAVTMLRAAVPFVAGVGVYRLHGGRLGEPWAIAAAGALVLTLFFPAGVLPSAVADVAFAAIVAGAAAVSLAELEPAALYLGRLSYPLYALHWPLAWWANRHGLVGPFGTLATLAAAWLAAHLALTLYDEPVRTWIGRQLRPGPGSNSQVQASRSRSRAS